MDISCRHCNCSIPRVLKIVEETISEGETNISSFSESISREELGFQPFVAIAVRQRAGCKQDVEEVSFFVDAVNAGDDLPSIFLWGEKAEIASSGSAHQAAVLGGCKGGALQEARRA